MGWESGRFFRIDLVGVDPLRLVVAQRRTGVLKDRLVEPHLESIHRVVQDAAHKGRAEDENEGRPDGDGRDHHDRHRHGREGYGEGREHPEGHRHGRVDQLPRNPAEGDGEPGGPHHHDGREKSGDDDPELFGRGPPKTEEHPKCGEEVDPEHLAMLVQVVLHEREFGLREPRGEEPAKNEVENVVERINAAQDSLRKSMAHARTCSHHGHSIDRDSRIYPADALVSTPCRHFGLM